MWTFLGMVAALVSAYAILFAHLLVCVWIDSVIPERFVGWAVVYYCGGAVLLFFALPYFMGLISAIFWHQTTMSDFEIGNWGCVTLLLLLLPGLVCTLGLSVLFMPLFQSWFERGARIGNEFWWRQGWKEWLGWKVPEVKQRKGR